MKHCLILAESFSQVKLLILHSIKLASRLLYLLSLSSPCDTNEGGSMNKVISSSRRRASFIGLHPLRYRSPRTPSLANKRTFLSNHYSSSLALCSSQSLFVDNSKLERVSLFRVAEKKYYSLLCYLVTLIKF